MQVYENVYELQTAFRRNSDILLWLAPPYGLKSAMEISVSQVLETHAHRLSPRSDSLHRCIVSVIASDWQLVQPQSYTLDSLGMHHHLNSRNAEAHTQIDISMHIRFAANALCAIAYVCCKFWTLESALHYYINLRQLIFFLPQI